MIFFYRLNGNNLKLKNESDIFFMYFALFSAIKHTLNLAATSKASPRCYLWVGMFGC